MKKAIIFGVTGQDGSYLSEFLLDRGDYEVVGVTRRCSVDNTTRVRHLASEPHFEVIEGDLTDLKSVSDIVEENQPDEIYNLAAQSHVGTSFKQPHYTWKVNAEGAFNVLESVRQRCDHCRIYQASTSEMFGSAFVEVNGVKLQNEETPFEPNSPYAIAKLAAHNAIRMYREAYGTFACSGILFNHESPRRGEQFVTRKVTMYVARLRKAIYVDTNGLPPPQGFPKLHLGNLDAYRDWGHAKDYVRGMWMMLQQPKADDYILSTGTTCSIRHLLTAAFLHIGVTDWEPYVVVDPKFYRPFDVEYLLGDCTKAREVLGWVPEYDFETLVHEMVDEDYRQALRRD